MSEVKQGIVKFFNDTKGLGFIVPSGGEKALFLSGFFMHKKPDIHSNIFL